MANRNAIFIWDPQYKVLPQNYQQALEMAEKYATVLEEPSDRLKRFAQEMAAYANAHQDDLEDDVFDFLDSMPYAVNEQTTIALDIELPDDDWEHAIVLTVEKATARGLIVVAPELIFAFLPHDKILSPLQSREWRKLCANFQQDDNESTASPVTNSTIEKKLPKTLKQYKKWAEEKFNQELSTFGFKLDQCSKHANTSELDISSVFIREVEIGQQYIHFRYAGRYPEFGQYVSFGICSSYIEEICQRLGFHRNNDILSSSLHDMLGYHYNDIEHVGTPHIQKEVNIIKDHIISLFDTASTITGLDQISNSDIYPKFIAAQKERYIAHRLIIARLANNSQFEQLAVKLRKYVKGAVKEALWDNLVKYLCEEIDPNIYWQQVADLEQEMLCLEEKRLLALQAQFHPKTADELIQLASQFHDEKTHLIWQQCCVGQQWLNGKVIGNEQELNWEEVQQILANVQHDGWRLPTFEELKTLKFSHRIGYITKDGFAFYEKQEVSFTHWINPFQNCWNNRCEDIYMVRVNNVENPTTNDAPTIYSMKPDLRGSLRLVKTAL